MHSQSTPGTPCQALSGGGDDTPDFNIRLAAKPGTPCAVCHLPTGAGPVAHRGHEAICDLCLLNDCTELGLVLALIAMTRAYATTQGDELEALQELDAFARIYERIAAKSGPPRMIRFPKDLNGRANEP